MAMKMGDNFGSVKYMDWEADFFLIQKSPIFGKKDYININDKYFAKIA